MTDTTPAALERIMERLNKAADDQEQRLGSFAGSLIMDDAPWSPMKNEYLSATTRGMEHVREIREAAAVIAALGVERDLAIAHDRQPYPTAKAYELVCAARTKWQERATIAKAKLREIAEIADYCLLDGHTFESLQANLRQIATIARTVGEKTP